MSQTAKAQEPSMEEILASIRRIIVDDDATKTTKAPEPLAPKPAAPPSPPPVAARPAPPPPPAATANRQSDIDAMLADLDKPKPALRAEPAKPPSPPPSPSNDVLDLTEAMASPSPSPGPAPTFRTIDGVFADRPMDAPRAEEPRRPPVQMPMPDPGLLSNATAAAVDSAFNTLAATVLGQNARTLEDLVKEMLRPMLKSWLDDNLPGLVERIVRAEIERVSRGKP
jgi:cell pole-organizing protein PopZ